MKNELLSRFPAGFLDQLQPSLRRVVLPQGTPVVEAGDPIDSLYFPQGGLISLLVVTTDGACVETSIVGLNGAFGIQRAFGERRSVPRAMVQVPGEFLIVPGTVFAAALRDVPAAGEVILEYLETLLAESQQGILCNALHAAPARMSRWLLQVADRTTSHNLPLTQEFIAQMLGVRRTTVTMIAQTMQQEGLVRYSRGRLTIANRAALESRACECYRTIGRYQHLHHSDERPQSASRA